MPPAKKPRAGKQNTESLLAQWQRGIALRGIAGAVLLMVPVVVAATIGFGGGLGVGLTSALEGPSESAVDTSPEPDAPEQASESLDTLVASDPPTTARGEARRDPLGVPVGTEPETEGATDPGAVVSPPSTTGSNETAGGPSTQSAPSADPGIGGSEPPPPIEVAPTAPPAPIDPLTDLLQGLLGSGTSRP